MNQALGDAEDGLGLGQCVASDLEIRVGIDSRPEADRLGRGPHQDGPDLW
jgi:hypothetical protein